MRPSKPDIEQLRSGDLTKHPDFYDYLKHLTTLSTGSIVLLATFADKFQKEAIWKGFLTLAMISFLLSVLASLVCMFFALSSQRYGAKEPPDWEGVIVITSFLLAASTLLTGLLSIGAFTIKNF